MCPRVLPALLCAAAAATTSHVVDNFTSTEGMFTLTSQVPPVSTTDQRRAEAEEARTAARRERPVDGVVAFQRRVRAAAADDPRALITIPSCRQRRGAEGILSPLPEILVIIPDCRRMSEPSP